MKRGTLYLAKAALIAAVYAAITITAAPISFGHAIFQFRISEALTILPAFTPAAIPGLFVGCIISNYIGGFGIYDIIFGSLATLIAAYCSFLLRGKKLLVPLPPVLFNASIVGSYLYFLYFKTEFPNVSVWVSIFYVGLGELLACYLLGYPLMLFISKIKQLKSIIADENM